MQEIAFQSIRNQIFSERGMPLDPPGGVNPLFKNILAPPLVGWRWAMALPRFMGATDKDDRSTNQFHYIFGPDNDYDSK